MPDSDLLLQTRPVGGILRPGLPLFAAGVERYPIPGGGTYTVPVRAGDRIVLEDIEGLQPCLLAYFDRSGRSAIAALGIPADGTAQELAGMLHAGTPSAKRVLHTLDQVGCDIGRAECARVFADGSHPEECAHFTAEADGILVVGTTGGPMAPDAGLPPTEIALYLRRANPQNRPHRSPPPPLAEPVADFNLAPGSARAYEVRAGQFIQILDVQGRECSDFQAWEMRPLESGRVAEIDPTTTRSMTGTVYPGPGIYAKYFSGGQTPMIEIVQDTVGRHDAFNLACTARYYEDLGYPGHLNCSDNLSVEAQAYGVAARPGWPAINFFYNTYLDATNGILMDEPWSRPGDFVLLRALTDLVCFSTACPCDVDPANGWEPTDVQVRVYDAMEDFPRAMAYRKTPQSEPQMTQQTAFHNRLAEQTRNFTEYAGYWLAGDYRDHGAIAEHQACREKAIVMDLSPLRKFEVTGPDAEALLQLCVTRDISRLSVGQVVYTAMCYEHGGMIDDGTVYRLDNDNFRWVGGADASGEWLRKQAGEHGMSAWVKSSTDQLHNIALQGPLSRKILAEFLWTPPTRPAAEELGWFRFTVGRIHDYEGASVLVSRTGYTGELGYEIFCHPSDGETVFDAVWKAGAPHGLTPCGLDALDLLRVEAGLVFAGQEFDDQTDPFEAGIGFTVPLKNENNQFIGREVLVQRKANPQRRLVGLDITGGETPASGDSLRIGRAQVGQITSAVRSPALGRVIALARIDVRYAEPGTEIEIGTLDGEQKRIPATVVRFPHYDPEKTRIRS